MMVGMGSGQEDRRPHFMYAELMSPTSYDCAVNLLRSDIASDRDTVAVSVNMGNKYRNNKCLTSDILRV